MLGKQEDVLYTSNTGDGAYPDPRELSALGDKVHNYTDLTEIYSTFLTGPYLQCMGRYPDGSYRILEAWVNNKRGVLPTSVISSEKAQIMGEIDDPWLREVFCQLQMVRRRPDMTKCTYLAKFYIRASKTPEVDNEPEAQEQTDDGDIGVSLGDVPSSVNRQGVRGHARGLVSSAVKDRLDGVEFLLPNCQTNTQMADKRVRGYQVNVQIQRMSAPLNKEDTMISPPTQLTGIRADCTESLLKTIFRNVLKLEYQELSELVGDTDLYSVPTDMKDKTHDVYGDHRWVLPSVSLSSLNRDRSDKDGKFVSFDFGFPQSSQQNLDSRCLSELLSTHDTEVQHDVSSRGEDDHPGITTQDLCINEENCEPMTMSTDKEDLTKIVPEIVLEMDTDSHQTKGSKKENNSRKKKFRNFIARIFSCLPLRRRKVD